MDFQQALNQIHPLTSAGWDAFYALLSPHSLEKNEYLLREGQRAYHGLLHEKRDFFFAQVDMLLEIMNECPHRD